MASATPNYVAPGTEAPGANYNPDDQVYTQSLIRESLVYLRDKPVFAPLGQGANLPKHMGMEMVRYIEYPLLDDRNKNDEGIDATGKAIANGNLYGSSFDIGKISAALPTLTENGGRVNRVGLTRAKKSATIKQYGIFTDMSDYLLTFDNQADIGESIIRRMLDGVLEMIDDITQLNLLQNVGTTVWTGAANSIATIDPTVPGTSPSDSKGSLLQFAHLSKLDELFSDNRTPMSTTMLSGSRNIDTRTVRTGRIAFVGVEMVNYLRNLVDGTGKAAFIDVQQYNSQGHTLENEVGTIGGYRIIQCRRMQKWMGGGAVTADAKAQVEYRTSLVGSDTRFNVYPFLVVGDEAFANLGLEMADNQYRLSVITKFPGRETAIRELDPFGQNGFCSIKFWYGFLPLKNERIACIYTALPQV